jgi:hypothetical protein
MARSATVARCRPLTVLARKVVAVAQGIGHLPATVAVALPVCHTAALICTLGVLPLCVRFVPLPRVAVVSVRGIEL